MKISLSNHLKPNRKLHWVSSTQADDISMSALNQLQSQMQFYYSNNYTYYEDISFGNTNWNDISSIIHQDVLKELSKVNSVIEVGCGSASSLTSPQMIGKDYTGVDFSDFLINSNRQRFSNANFIQLTNPLSLPLKDNIFDMVFSMFVIEHCVFPHKFLLEKVRVIKKGGKFCLLCPNFLGIGKMTSQRKGFSAGTGTEKLKQGRFFDSLISSFDAKLRIPFVSRYYRNLASVSPQFFINLRPTCFVDTFQPDIDAIYLTYEPEMKSFLSDYIDWHPLEKELIEYCKFNNLIYLKGTKKRSMISK